MKKCKWLFDYHMLKDSYHDDLTKICEKLNIEYEIIKYIPLAKTFNLPQLEKNPTFEKDSCVVAYGSIEFLKALETTNKNYIPMRYMEEKFLTCSYYLPYIPSRLLLNDNYIMLPYGEFIKNPKRIYDLYETNELFVRPDSGLKTFAGTTIHIDDFDYEILSLENLSSVMSNTMILLSPIKKILSEYRIVVGNREIIASSRYKLNDKLNMKEGAPIEAINIAKEVAALDFQPDLVYTADVAELSDGTYKIIELNSFSAAGLYHCNPVDILTKVSAIAEKEHRQDIAIGD